MLQRTRKYEDNKRVEKQEKIDEERWKQEKPKKQKQNKKYILIRLPFNETRKKNTHVLSYIQKLQPVINYAAHAIYNNCTQEKKNVVDGERESQRKKTIAPLL